MCVVAYLIFFVDTTCNFFLVKLMNYKSYLNRLGAWPTDCNL